MKIRNTTAGDIIIGEVAFPSKKTVTLGDAQLAELETFKDNPAVAHYFKSGALVDGDTVEDDEPEVVDEPAEGTRDSILAEVIKNLDQTTGFLASGAPRVEAINGALPLGVDPVSAEERDAIWAKIQAGAA